MTGFFHTMLVQHHKVFLGLSAMAERLNHNILTRWTSTCTNLAKPELRGDPLYNAMEAPFNNEAYTNQGPIIHPRLVGQATTSPARISMWHHASAAALRGVALVHGMAFGSPTAEI